MNNITQIVLNELIDIDSFPSKYNKRIMVRFNIGMISLC